MANLMKRSLSSKSNILNAYTFLFLLFETCCWHIKPFYQSSKDEKFQAKKQNKIEKKKKKKKKLIKLLN